MVTDSEQRKEQLLAECKVKPELFDRVLPCREEFFRYARQVHTGERLSNIQCRQRPQACHSGIPHPGIRPPPTRHQVLMVRINDSRTFEFVIIPFDIRFD